MAAGANETPSPARRSTRARKPVQRFGRESDADAAKDPSPPAKRQRRKGSPAEPRTPTKKTPATKASPATEASPTAKPASPASDSPATKASSPAAMASSSAKASPATKASSPAKASPASKASSTKKASPAAKAEDAIVDKDSDDAAAADEEEVDDDDDDDYDNLHAVLRLDPDEVEEYEGWTELESDPALFNDILHKLGVSGVRCEEVLVIDEGEVMLLKQPIHGFIFLFECDDAPEAEETVDPPEGMWFARQTIANACASVALFNILMNAEGIGLGEEMQRFKDETADLIPPHRGTALAQNRFIRKIHDSFARRLDLLDEDLCLSNRYDEYQKRKKKKKGVAKPKAKQSRKRKRKAEIDPNAAKHYVAYIQHGGQLWELDGLEEAAIALGPVGDNWINAVIPVIQQKLNELGDQANLIALCHNERDELKQKLAANVASIVALSKTVEAHGEEWRKKVKELEKVGWAADPEKAEYAAALADMGLSAEEVAAAAEAKADKEAEEAGPYETEEEAAEAASDLVKAHLRLRADYDEERALAEADADTARGRQTDLTAMVHTWVELMAEADIIDVTAEAVAAGAGVKGAKGVKK